MSSIADDNIAQDIGKMLRETIEGKLKWHVDDTTNVGSNIDGYDTVIGNIYFTVVYGRNIRLYKYKTRYYTDIDEWYWSIGYQLEFYNNSNNKVIWAFPDSNTTVDLYNEVSFKASGIDDFMKGYLK